MKKWWIGLLLAAVALVMIPATALALLLIPSVAIAWEVFCPTCKDFQHIEFIDDYEYFNDSKHAQKGECQTCKATFDGGTYESHTETRAATCQSPAYCGVCKHDYGSPNPNAHNWSDWLPNQFNPNLHYRYCMNIGCSASESESHDGNSNCVTPATCSKCNASYTDTTKHAGPFKYSYNKYDESFHKRIETCTACGNETGNQVDTQHEESTPANCAHAAWCNVCNQAYGNPNPNNHGWGNWTYENENQHYRICSHNESHIQHADHRGYATCIDSMPCLDCDCSYKDPDKHQGGTDFDYTNVSDTEHKVTVICKGCHGEIKTYQEGHSEHTPATCSSRAICAKCSTPFGDLAPNNHIGEATTTYVKTSETQHTAKITYADCKHMVDGESTDHTETTAATCSAGAYCAVCKSSYGSTDPDNHVGTPTTTYAKTSETQHTAKITYADCRHAVDGASIDHTETTAATCTAAAYCDVCKSSYGDPDPDAHDLVQHDAQAPTCTKIGWNAYEACKNCSYTTYEELPKLGHWYAEWMPNADATHTAFCKRGYEHQKTVDCIQFTYTLTTGNERVEVTLCPVCGEVSEIRLIDENGEVVETREAVRLLVEYAKAEALTKGLPGGELVVHMGALESGEVLMSVAFEWGGKPTQPTGQVKITLPAEVLEGYALCLLSEDGAETELALEGDEEETVSFTLDFTNSETPVQVIRLVPEV